MRPEQRPRSEYALSEALLILSKARDLVGGYFDGWGFALRMRHAPLAKRKRRSWMEFMRFTQVVFYARDKLTFKYYWTPARRKNVATALWMVR
jgi:hypothetical protein